MPQTTPDSLMSVGEIASRAGITVPTLRYYDERGLVYSQRTSGNQRRYKRMTLRRLALVAAGQRVGLSIEQIKTVLDRLPRDKAPSQADWSEISREWAQLVERRIRELRVLETSLESCIGCGCLSLQRCSLVNPGDTAAGEGSGSRWSRRASEAGAGPRLPLEDLHTSLSALPESEPRDAYLRFLNAAGEAALRRNGGPEHVTGSCFVFSPAFDQVLLSFHRKGQFWVQFGGHIESTDASVAETAQRETREESGIAELVLLSPAIMDLDRHDLNSGFSCAAHWDVGFAAVIAPDAEISVSDESEDVRWFPIDALPAEVPAGFGARLERVRLSAMSLRGGAVGAGDQ